MPTLCYSKSGTGKPTKHIGLPFVMLKWLDSAYGGHLKREFYVCKGPRLPFYGRPYRTIPHVGNLLD